MIDSESILFQLILNDNDLLTARVLFKIILNNND